MKKILKYGLVVPGWFLLGMLALILLVLLIIQTEPAKRKIAALAGSLISKNINGTLSVGEIEGNLLNEISLKKVVLTQGNDTLAGIDEIHARYNLLPLLQNTLVVHSAKMVKPRFFLRQINDSVWNFMQVTTPAPEVKKTEKESTGNFYFRLPSFSLESGLITIEAFDSIIPVRIENLNTELMFIWEEKDKLAELKQFSFSAIQPDFNLKRLEFSLALTDHKIDIQNFKIQTAINTLDGEASFAPEKMTGDARFVIPGLHLKEFSSFAPSLQIPATPRVDLSVRLDSGLVQAMLYLEDRNQKISIQAGSENLADFLFHPGDSVLRYDFSCEFDRFEPAYWLGTGEVPYILDGAIKAAGRGFDPATAQLTATGRLNPRGLYHLQPGLLYFDLNLDQGNLTGTVEGQGNFGRFRVNSLLKNLPGEPDYQADILTQNLNLEELTGIKELNSNLNMKAEIRGKGFDPEKIFASARLNILNSRVLQISFDTIDAVADYRNSNLVISRLRARTPAALITASGNYSLKSASGMQLYAAFSGLEDFHAVLPDTVMGTSGTIRARLWGTPGMFTLQSTAALDTSRYGAITLAKLNLHATAHVTAGDTLLQARLHAEKIQTGNLLIDSVNTLVTGGTDSLYLKVNLDMDEMSSQLETGVVPGETLKLALNSWQINFKNRKWLLQHPPALIEINAEGSQVNNFRLSSGMSGEEQFIAMGGEISRHGEQDFNLEIGNVNLKNLTELFVPNAPVAGLLDVDVHLSGKADSLVLNSAFLLNEAAYNGLSAQNIRGKLGYAENRVDLETVVSDDSTGTIKIEAGFPLKISVDSMFMQIPGNEPVDGQVTIRDVPLDELKKLGTITPAEGIFQGGLRLSGTVESPAVEGEFAIQDAALKGYRLLNLEGALNYRNNLLLMNALVIPQDSGKLEAIGAIPLHFSADSMKLIVSGKDSIQGKLTLDNLSLELVQAMVPSGHITGSVNGELNLSGTLESPDPDGFLELQNASLVMHEYGIEYRDVGFKINLLGDQVKIDRLLVRSRDGNLTGSGQVDFSPDLLKGDVRNSEIVLNFNRFQPLNHRQFNMQVNGNATFGGKKGEVVYGGSISIPRSEIYIPAVLRMMGRMSAPEMPEPLLVREMEKMYAPADTVDPEPLILAVSDSSGINYFDNFKGNLRIRIPRNTWIKNKDMYIEISGDLELIKNSEYFELFGSVDVVRGQYDLLGKTFVIDEGSINFQGGENMVPYINIRALYLFRNARRVEQELSVQVSGTTELPEVRFHLDGNAVSEGDALSYLLFGKSMNELTIDEQDNMAGSGGGSLAEKAAASILSAQISNFLGDKLAVDYLEVISDQGFDNATVVVGKYITNDLFVSYEQRFGEIHEKNVAKYEVKLEYELFRFLFFELNNSSRESGFDIIFKFDSK